MTIALWVLGTLVAILTLFFFFAAVVFFISSFFVKDKYIGRIAIEHNGSLHVFYAYLTPSEKAYVKIQGDMVFVPISPLTGTVWTPGRVSIHGVERKYVWMDDPQRDEIWKKDESKDTGEIP